MSQGDEPFLSRWSRRKVEAREEAAAPEEPPEAAPVPAAAQEPPQPLPPVESLTTESDFKPFMAADVAPETRRAALKKLFADARYNVHDPFEAYMEDYTREDPIPLEMLERLEHARHVLFEEQAPADPQPDAQVEPNSESRDGAAKQDA